MKVHVTSCRSDLRSSRLAAWAGVFSIVSALAAPLPLLAEGPDVKATLVAPATAAPGSTAKLAVEMTIGQKWHVNSHAPSEAFLIPTNVTLRTSTGKLSSVRYPKHVEKRLAFWDKPLRVYEGTVRFESDLALPPDTSGKVRVTGTLSYQACNDQQCFAPAEIVVEASVTTPATSRPRR